VHINSTANNTHLVLTDRDSRVQTWVSSGTVGYKNANKVCATLACVVVCVLAADALHTAVCCSRGGRTAACSSAQHTRCAPGTHSRRPETHSKRTRQPRPRPWRQSLLPRRWRGARWTWASTLLL
jgi:hypothetical protein